MTSEDRATRIGPPRLAWVFFRVSAMNELHYRANFFIQLAQSLLALGTGLVALALVFSRTDDLDGWSQAELLVVMGVFTLVGGLIGFAIEPNMGRVLADIHLGTFDYVLTKPADSQLLSSVRQFNLWRLVDAGVVRRNPPATPTDSPQGSSSSSERGPAAPNNSRSPNASSNFR